MSAAVTQASEMELDISQELIQSPDHKVAGTSEATFDGLLDQPLKLHEDLTEGCGGQLWPAGIVLAKYLLRKPKDAFHGFSMFVCFQEALYGVEGGTDGVLQP